MAVLLVGAGLWVFTHQASAAPTYRMAAATLGTVTQTIPISGNLAPVNQTDLDFAASGKVQSIKVSAGQQVNAGDVLATLDPTSLSGAVVTAQANLSAAQAKLSLDQAGPTAQNLAQSQAAVNTGAVQLQNAQTTFNDTVASNQQALAQAQSTVGAAQATVISDQSVLDADRARQPD